MKFRYFEAILSSQFIGKGELCVYNKKTRQIRTNHFVKTIVIQNCNKNETLDAMRQKIQ